MNNATDQRQWPLYVDGMIRDYGPLRLDEWGIFTRIVSRAGWDGGWCTESAETTAKAFADMSKRIVYDVWQFLVQAGMVEKSKEGHYRPRRICTVENGHIIQGWVDPEQLPIIRAKLYAYRQSGKRKQAVAQEPVSNVAVLSVERAARTPQHATKKNQTSLISLSSVFDFHMTDDMHEWASRECPNVVHPSQVTQKFIAEMDTKVKGGWNLDSVDLVEEWKTFMNKSQWGITQRMQKGRRNVVKQRKAAVADSDTDNSNANNVRAFGGTRFEYK